MPNKEPAFPAARVKDPISVGLSIIVGGEDTVLIGGAPKPIACSDCKARLLMGNPVNIGSGAKVQPTETDFLLPAPMPFAMERFYASDTPFTGLLGQGWRTPLEFYCDADIDRTRVVDIQGRWIDFAPLALGEEQHCPSEGVWVARGTTDTTIPWEERWQWLPEDYRHNPHLIIVTPGEGNYLVFEALVKPTPTKDNPSPVAEGRFDLRVMLSRHGYSTHLRWHGMHNAAGLAVRVPEFVTDSASRIYRLHCVALPDEHKPHWSSGHADIDNGIRLSGISLAYDPLRDSKAPADLAALRDLRVTEWLVRYQYSQAGDLVEVQDADGDWTRRFEYEQHLMTRHQTPGGGAESVALDVRYEYDRQEPNGKVIRQIQTGGLHYSFIYDEHETSVTDSLGRITRYQFEGRAGVRRLVQQTRADGSIVKMQYTRDGKMSRLTDPLGRVTHFLHNSGGEYLGSVNPLGHRQERYLDRSTGLVSSIRDAEGRSTHIERDSRGRVTQLIAADGSKTCYEYSHPHFPDRPSAVIDARGGKKIPTYNALGQLDSFTDCSGQTTRYRHDRKGRLLEIESADGKRQSYVRDQKGRIIRATLPGGSEESFHYDRANRLVKAIDAEGRPVELTYDRFDRVTEHRIWAGENTASAAGWSVTRYNYDPAGRLARLTNPAGAVTVFGYDVMDRLLRETGFDGKECAFSYNLAGELTNQIHAKGSADALVIGYEHDAGGRLIARHLPAWDGSPEQIHRFAYNKRNQIVRAGTYNSQVDFAYNALGQLIAETQSSMDGFSRTLRFGYDILGNRNQLLLPDGRSIDTLMIGSGHWHQLAFDGHPLVDVERDSMHREIHRTYGSGSPHMTGHPLIRTQSYTELSQLDISSFTRGGKLVEERRHRYDPAGLLTRIDRELDGLRAIVRYGYDAQQRLAAWDMHDVHQNPPSADNPDGRPSYKQTQAQAYAHDQAGNPIVPGTVIRLDPVSNMPVYVPPAKWEELVKANAGNPEFNVLGTTPIRANRIAQLGQTFHDEYDQRGNVRKRRTPEGIWEFGWNALDQMTVSRFTPAGSGEPAWTTTYYYDAFGRRIGKLFIDLRHMRHDDHGKLIEDSVLHALTRFLWDGDRMLQEIHANHVKTIVYEPHGFVPLAQVVQWKPAEVQATLSQTERERRWMEQQNLTMLMAEGSLSPDITQAMVLQLCGDGDQEDMAIHLFVTDHLGTPYRMIETNTHEVVWERSQDPWGNTIKEMGSDRLKRECIPELGFQGQQWDWEIDLYYNRYRYYDARMHRYLTQDPIRLLGGLNFYGYSTNPVQGIDPLGLFVQAVYDRTNSLLTVTDASGTVHSFAEANIASGTSQDPCEIDRGAIPAGKYQIKEGKYRAPDAHWPEGGTWYQLQAKDSRGKLSYTDLPAMGADGKPCNKNRGAFNLHAGSGTNGCITFMTNPRDSDYNQKNVTNPQFDRLRKILDNTSKKTSSKDSFVGELIVK